VDRLSGLFSTACSGSGRIAFISGPPGIGKSRLVSEFVSTKAGAGTLLLYGKCGQRTRNLPYYPLVTAVSDRLSSDVLSPTTEERRLALRNRLFELSDLLSGGTSRDVLRLDMEQERERFFNLLVNLVASLATFEHPLLVVLDDLQWADHGTIEFVERMAARIASFPLLLIGAYRDDELDPLQNLPSMLTRLEARAVRFALQPLGTESVQEMTRLLAGEEAGQADKLAQFLVGYGEGNPFRIVTLTSTLADKGILSVGAESCSVDWAALSSFASQGSVDRPLLSLVERLEPELVELLKTASAIGDTFDIRHLASPDETTGEIRNSLAEAENHGVVSRVDEHRYAFGHDQFREHFYSTIPVADRRQRHQAIAERMEALSDLQDQQVLLQLAEHYSRGTDVGKALHFSLQAGDISARSHAYESARRYFKAALVMAKGVAEEPEALRKLRFTIHSSLGGSYAATGDYELALDQYDHANEHAIDAEQRSDVSGKRSLVFFKRGELVPQHSDSDRL